MLVEAAAWNFLNIRQTARQHQLLSEAAFRFSRGVHPSLALLGATRTAELLRRHAGGTVAEGVVDSYPLPAETVTVDLDPDYVRRLSGLDLEPAEMAELLERLAFEVESADGRLRVSAPDHRLDIDGPHDLVEEICRMVGYDRIPSTVISDSLPPQRGNPDLEQEERIKDLLVEEGLFEVVTYRLTTEEALARTGVEGHSEESYVKLVNPSTAERVVMRHTLLGSVLEIAAANSRFRREIRIFEIGEIYVRPEGEPLPQTQSQIAIVLTGPRCADHWQTGEAAHLDFYDLKGVVESLLEALEVDGRFEPAEHPTLRPGATASLVAADGDALGVLGELHPRVADGYGFRLEEGQGVFAVTLDLGRLRPLVSPRRTIASVPTHPAIREDLALVVGRDVAAARVESVLRKAGGPLLVEVELFDVYEGENVGGGEKSLAYHLTFQSPDRTLRDKDAEKARRRILATLERELGARLR